MKERNTKLILKIQQGIQSNDKRMVDEAFETLIDDNHPLITKFISPFLKIDYVDNNFVYNLTYSVMANKVKSFDVNLGYSFFTYCHKAIFLELVKFIDREYENIRIPYHVKTKLDKIRRDVRESDLELSELEEYLKEEYELTDKDMQVFQPLLCERTTYPLDQTRTAGIRSEYKPCDHIGDTRSVKFDICPEDYFECLTNMEEDIIRMRFGLEPYSYPHKLREIASKYERKPQYISMKVKEARLKLRDAITKGHTK